jgi:hypothetical protein
MPVKTAVVSRQLAWTISPSVAPYLIDREYRVSPGPTTIPCQSAGALLQPVSAIMEIAVAVGAAVGPVGGAGLLVGIGVAEAAGGVIIVWPP